MICKLMTTMNCSYIFSKVIMGWLIILMVTLFEVVLSNCKSTTGLIWSKNQKNFVKISSIPQFATLQKEAFSKSRSLEVHNFEGEILKATYYEETNIVEFYDNNTKVTGICGEIWHLLSEYLNFKLEPLKQQERSFGELLSNNSYSGLMGVLQRKEADVIFRVGCFAFRAKQISYSVPIWKTSYQLYIRPEWKYDNTWVVTLFSRKAWYTILALFFILGIVGYILEKLYSCEVKNKNAAENFNLIDHLFHTFSMMCSQGYIPDAYYRQFKVLTLSKSIFCWFVMIAFSSNLIQRMAYRNVEPPFEDLTDMIDNSNYTALIFDGTMIKEQFLAMLHRMYDETQISQHFQFINSSQNMQRETCYSEKNYAMLNAEDKQIISKSNCQLMPVGKKYFQTWIAAGIATDFKYKRTIDIGIIKLQEVGIMDVLKDRFIPPKMERLNANSFKTIDLDQVELIFAMFFVGAVMSIIVLIIENVVYLYENH